MKICLIYSPKRSSRRSRSGSRSRSPGRISRSPGRERKKHKSRKHRDWPDSSMCCVRVPCMNFLVTMSSSVRDCLVSWSLKEFDGLSEKGLHVLGSKEREGLVLWLLTEWKEITSLLLVIVVHSVWLNEINLQFVYLLSKLDVTNDHYTF